MTRRPEAIIAWYDEHLASYWGPLPDEPVRSMALGLSINGPTTVHFNGRRIEPLGIDLTREARDLLDAELQRWRTAYRVGGRGHGKVAMQKAIMDHHKRNVVQSKMMATPPAVDVKRVKWSAVHNVDINSLASTDGGQATRKIGGPE